MANASSAWPEEYAIDASRYSASASPAASSTVRASTRACWAMARAAAKSALSQARASSSSSRTDFATPEPSTVAAWIANPDTPFPQRTLPRATLLVMHLRGARAALRLVMFGE